ncbi:hypothetical protein IA539_04405 [Gordonia sp. zg691]|uniref:hypothetical protein n=1 Tax=Gordonia jinghuaiqii TaxID=2758710 RepID=UPI0016622178|nr:hypothetical protein [Gordonia jinghuaiqii]MBD0860449.1 hypothetical protein [Gordonia jinghuaiqii]
MRKLVAGVAIGGSLTIGAVGTLLVVDSSSPAAPSAQICSSFSGSGPVPFCSFRVDGSRLQIILRNNATGIPPVLCSLTPSGANRPTDTVTLGPGERGTLGAVVPGNLPRSFDVGCEGGAPGNDRVSRHTTIIARGEAAGPRTTNPAPRRYSAPAPPPSTRDAPSTRSAPAQPVEPADPPRSDDDGASKISPPDTTTTTTTVPRPT